MVVQEARGGGGRVCSGVHGDAGVGCGGPGAVAPWLARGPPKAGLVAIINKIWGKRCGFVVKYC